MLDRLPELGPEVRAGTVARGQAVAGAGDLAVVVPGGSAPRTTAAGLSGRFEDDHLPARQADRPQPYVPALVAGAQLGGVAAGGEPLQVGGQVLGELVVDEVVGAGEHAAVILLGGVEHGGVRRLEREGDQLAEPQRRAGGRRGEVGLEDLDVWIGVTHGWGPPSAAGAAQHGSGPLLVLLHRGVRGLGKLNWNSARAELRDQVEDVSEDPTTEDATLAALDDGLGEQALVSTATGREGLRDPEDESEIPETEVDLHAHGRQVIDFLVD